MKIDAHIESGRMVASAYRKPSIIRNRKVRAYLWYDTRDVGGIYERVEEWMWTVAVEQGEPVIFKIRKE